MTIAISQARTLATPATAAEIEAIPVEVKLRLPRKDWQRLAHKSMTTRLGMSGMLRHLITTHPLMQQEDTTDA